MYYTAPGHRHVQVLVPQLNRSPAVLGRLIQARNSGSAAPPPNAAAEVEPVVAEALNAALSKHRATSMMAWRFAPAVRAHIRARQHAAALTNAPTSTAPAADRLQVVTCHAREGGEFFGTVETQDGTRRAYAAKICDGKLVSFKVL
ncbi:hypothetical protein HMPREF3151_11400 [Corynebacterium sp. HMSC05H05]|uniref:Uncharacterized protein n=1 Tax=Corynebacterium haemomassiliense TaxID=2754726 RepID=A0A7W2I4M9_9CORY|nr:MULTISPECIES: hypothetical protein [Corynebacterium]MBA5245329.1 hypothetical protein [Corynebacterium haemomassiliense]MCG7288784.1 hypothetical protein [Corynebacterium sp. ACRPZ]MCG7294460.1 hypothetical protein [Corynebacterium sp. ACRPY]OFT55638.1 hypothetical protein HMPREF3151_11400 [Corynebacterium sp. HMSC05H05]